MTTKHDFGATIRLLVMVCQHTDTPRARAGGGGGGGGGGESENTLNDTIFVDLPP